MNTTRLQIYSFCLLCIGLFTLIPTRSVLAKPPTDNPIVIENKQAGSNKWRLKGSGFKNSNDVEKQIKGYASETSINKGETISFFVTVNPVQTFTIDIYRMGWYQGQGGRHLQKIGPLEGIQQADCPTDATTGMISCAWSSSYILQVPDNWTSGIYLALLTNKQKYQNYIIFVVRDDNRIADLLYQQPVATYQAYNNYPDDDTTGKSFYNFNSFGEETISGKERAVQVSFDRPYRNNGGGNFLAVEVNFVQWLEKSGYDVAYSTSIDTHIHGRRLLYYKGFLSVGHDEYWSKQMYDAVEIARNRGINLAFFGANDMYWQIRLAPSTDGRPNRVMICYKDADIDTIENERLKTIQWRDDPVNRPEQSLIGIQYTANINDESPYIITNSDNWVYTDTSFTDGDTASKVVGGEVDGYMPEYPLPPNLNYTLLSNTPVINTKNEPDYANSSIYQSLSGSWVFAAGSITWSYGLGKDGYTDNGIKKMTSNVLDMFISFPQPNRQYNHICSYLAKDPPGKQKNFDCRK